MKDRHERKHRRTARHPACIEMMANANFDAVPSLAEAMGLTSEEPMTKIDGKLYTEYSRRMKAIELMRKAQKLLDEAAKYIDGDRRTANFVEEHISGISRDAYQFQATA